MCLTYEAGYAYKTQLLECLQEEFHEMPELTRKKTHSNMKVMVQADSPTLLKNISFNPADKGDSVLVFKKL